MTTRHQQTDVHESITKQDRNNINDPQMIYNFLSGITRIITKVNQVTIVQSNYTYLYILMSDLLPNPKDQGCGLGQTFQLHNMICNTTFLKRECFDLVTPHRGRVCVKGHTTCLHGVLCFISINLIWGMTTFQKKHFDPTPGSRVSVRANYLLYMTVCFILFKLICNTTIF